MYDVERGFGFVEIKDFWSMLAGGEFLQYVEFLVERLNSERFRLLQDAAEAKAAASAPALREAALDPHQVQQAQLARALLQ